MLKSVSRVGDKTMSSQRQDRLESATRETGFGDDEILSFLYFPAAERGSAANCTRTLTQAARIAV